MTTQTWFIMTHETLWPIKESVHKKNPNPNPNPKSLHFEGGQSQFGKSLRFELFLFMHPSLIATVQYSPNQTIKCDLKMA